MVTMLLYFLFGLLKGTVAMRIFYGIITIFIAWKIVSLLNMKMLEVILGAFISVGFIALIVIFQPEIRHFLLTLGNTRIITSGRKFLFWRLNNSDEFSLDIDPLIKACHRMSELYTGALIVIARENSLKSFAETGEILDAKISSQLIENLFFKNAPLHDGALIISNNRILSAGSILPLSDNSEIPKQFGLRHRAAIGISEKTDAIAIIVSEQTGRIALTDRGNFHRNIKPAQLREILSQEFKVKAKM